MAKKGLHIMVSLLLVIIIPSRSHAQSDTLLVAPNVSQVSSADTSSQFDIMDHPARVETRAVPDSLRQEVRTDVDYWYANTVPQRQQPKKVENSPGIGLFDKKWFRNTLWFLMIAIFVVILLWFLASSNIRLFQKKTVPLVDDAMEISEENMFNLDYEKEIQKAVREGNFRLGIRLWYLRTLRELSEKNMIQYKHERTNSEYLQQLEHTAFHKDFFRLTRNFEYIWYGQFPLEAEGFERVQKDFLIFQKQVGS